MSFREIERPVAYTRQVDGLLERTSGLSEILNDSFTVSVSSNVTQGADGTLTLPYAGTFDNHPVRSIPVGGRAVFDKDVKVEELETAGFQVKPTLLRRVKQRLGLC